MTVADVEPPPSYMAKFERIARAMYLAVRDRTGPVTIHMAQGHPNGIEIPGEPTRIVLDKGKKRAHA